MPKVAKEPIERITLKLPKSVAEYFRKAFPHGRRSDIVAKWIREYRHEHEIAQMEKKLKEVGKKRQ